MNDEHKPHKPLWWQNFDWPGVIAFILASGISISMVLAIAGALTRPQPLGEYAGVFLSTMFGASIGAVATYLGQANARRNPPPQ